MLREDDLPFLSRRESALCGLYNLTPRGPFGDPDFSAIGESLDAFEMPADEAVHSMDFILAYHRASVEGRDSVKD